MIAGKKIDLIRPTKKDWKLVQRIWEDEETMADVGGRALLNKEQYDKWFKYMFLDKNEENEYFLIIEKTGRDCIGEVSFHRYDKYTKRAMFNIKIIKGQRGKGFGTEAMDLILEYYFNTWKGEVMEDSLWEKNPNGLKMLKAYGFSEFKIDDEGIWVEMKKGDWKKRGE